IDDQQPTNILARGVEVIEVHRLPAVNRAHAHDVALFAHDVDQLELLEHGGDRLEAPPDLRPRLDGNAKGRGVVEEKTHKSGGYQPLAPVGDVEIQADQVREINLALFVMHREIVPTAVVEIAHAGYADAVAVDESSWHQRDFRPPVPIVRGSDREPP